jgi:hypothetical protein
MTVASVGHHGRTTEAVSYRLSIEMAGLLTLLLGAWGGIVAYVGPTFSFSADGALSWTWNLAHSLLFLLPGAGACLAGLLILIAGTSTRTAAPVLVVVAALLALLSGAWFVVGPLAWPALKGSVFFIGASPLKELEYWIGYSLGPGGLLLILGAFALGRSRVSSPETET